MIEFALGESHVYNERSPSVVKNEILCLLLCYLP